MQSMVGRRKVISSPHRRTISPLITLPPTFRLPRGLEHLEQRLPVMRWTAIRTVNATRIEGTNVPATLDSGSFRFNNTGPAHADVGLIDASSAALQTPYNTPTDRAVTPAAPAVILQRPS